MPDNIALQKIAESVGFIKQNTISGDKKHSLLMIKNMDKVEIKHGRLGMFTTIGRPIYELFHPYLSKITQNTNILSFNNKVPSILNGALEKINPIFLMSIIILFFMRIGTRM